MGQFDFEGRDSRGLPCMRLSSFHPGFTVEQIQARTGFELQIKENISETPIPSAAELRLLREEIDPLGVRRLELLSGSPRKQLLHAIITAEKSA